MVLNVLCKARVIYVKNNTYTCQQSPPFIRLFHSQQSPEGCFVNQEATLRGKNLKE